MCGHSCFSHMWLSLFGSSVTIFHWLLHQPKNDTKIDHAFYPMIILYVKWLFCPGENQKNCF